MINKLIVFMCSITLFSTLAFGAGKGVELHKVREISFGTLGRAGNWSDFVVSDEGTVFLLDGQAVRVDVFSSAGVLQETKTYAGQGPGEFVPNPRIHTLGTGFWLCAEGKMAQFDDKGRLLHERRSKSLLHRQIPISGSTALMVRDEMGDAPKKWQSSLALIDIESDREIKGLLKGENLGFLFLKVSYGYVYFWFDGGIMPNIFANYAPWRGGFVCGLTASDSVGIYDAKGNEIRKVMIKLTASAMSDADRLEIVSNLGTIDASQKIELQKILPKHFTPIKNAHLLGPSKLLIEHPLAATKTQYLLFSDKGEPLGEVIFPVFGNITKMKCNREHIGLLIEEEEETRYCEFTLGK